MTKHQRYNKSAKGRARYKRFRESEKGRMHERHWGVERSCRARAVRIQQIEEELRSRR